MMANPSITVPSLSGSIPANLVSVIVESSGQMNSTEQVQLPDTYAAGEVLITNLTDEEHEIPIGTIVLTTDDEERVRFMTVDTYTIPGGVGEQLTIPVRAVLAGTGSNLDADEIAVFAGGLGLYLAVSNPEPLTGGSDRSSPMPGESDYEELNQQVMAELESLALDQLESLMWEGQLFIPETMKLEEILEEERFPPEGQPADFLQMTVRAEFSGWYIEEVDLQQMAQIVLDASLAQNLYPVPDSLTVTWVEPPVFGGESIEGEVLVLVQVKPVWDPGLEAQLLSKTPGAAVELLSENYDLLEPPAFEFFPPWWRRLPNFYSRMEVILE
jgi:hypothetical protein